MQILHIENSMLMLTIQVNPKKSLTNNIEEKVKFHFMISTDRSC